ncbi:hypothetical protein HPP92_018258 [Vanilla planifolia]|uniref:Uncharacterized protein n=1 Tax=Vanilla planifolia TaxID=51239 RepID=A0A835QE20_VANPL|nr:hypothetical protein HPP92_018874 [Vanilla planifolia]KAG0468930.1 hypothetical protein HPP92_018258 [Vanilla planifolia]
MSASMGKTKAIKPNNTCNEVFTMLIWWEGGFERRRLVIGSSHWSDEEEGGRVTVGSGFQKRWQVTGALKEVASRGSLAI